MDRWTSTNGRIVSLTLCGVLAGCTINPTAFGIVEGKFKQDITVDIVKKIRCEARDAMVRLAAGLMEGELPDFQRPDSKYLDNTEILKTIDLMKKYPGSVKTMKLWDIPYASRILASNFLNTKISLDFIITTKETNNNSLSPKLTSSHGAHKIDLNIGTQSIKGDRQNKRTLKLPAVTIGSFQDLDCPRDYPFSRTPKSPIKNNPQDKFGHFSSRQQLKLAAAGSDKKSNFQAKQNGVVAELSDPAYPMRGNVNLIKTVESFFNFVHLGSTYPERRIIAQSAFKSAAEDLVSYTGQSALAKTQILDQTLESYQKLRGCSQSQLDVIGSECQTIAVCLDKIHKRASILYRKRFYELPDTPVHFKLKTTYTEQLLFTTTVNSGISPTITFSSPAALSLQSLGIGITPSRVDTHQLTTSFTVAPKPIIPDLFIEKKTTSKEVILSKIDGYKVAVYLPETTSKEVDNTCQLITNKVGGASRKEVKFTAKKPPRKRAPKGQAATNSVNQKFLPVATFGAFITQVETDENMAAEQQIINVQKRQIRIENATEVILAE